ncbi:hypothetical protein [uncultured Enterococcus sp.]|uniref:hypothetical protein n=1 Tax=uncultured Enterococcus sp. TaxID=167972 RepID=UPI002AA90546|nr:hypothetical protein [uncultured Enterococcus sp.]
MKIFKAKPTENKKMVEELTGQKLDSEGYIHGYYVDGCIVGDFVEVTDEYAALEFWCEVDPDTLQVVKLSTNEWNQLTTRQKLIRAGYSEKQLDEMLKEYPDDDPEEVFENELSEMASNAEWEEQQ